MTVDLVAMEIVALPTSDNPVCKIQAYSSAHALQLFARDRGIVGGIEHDREHGVVLVGDRIVYTAVAVR